MKKFENITKYQLEKNGVVSLADKPNSKMPYGKSGLTPQELKQWFDKLSILLATKINEIQDELASNGADYIPLNFTKQANDELDIVSLDEFVDAVESGLLANIYLRVNDYPYNYNVPLQTFLNNLKKTLDNTNRKISTDFAKTIRSTFQNNNLRIEIYNDNNALLGSTNVDLSSLRNDEILSRLSSVESSVATNANAILSTRQRVDDIEADYLKQSDKERLEEKIEQAGYKISFAMDDQYRIFADLLDRFDNVISRSNVIDLPIESVVVDGRYDDALQKVILTLENKTEIAIPIGQIISGLVSTSTLNNALSGKLDKPINSGRVNQFLSLTANGIEWVDAPQGSGGSGGTISNIKTINGKSIIGDGDLPIIDQNNPEALINLKSLLAQIYTTEEVEEIINGINTELGKKLEKNTSISSYNQVYGKGGNGAQQFFNVMLPAYSAAIDGIPFRQGGHMSCTAPTASYHTTNKAYVDNAVKPIVKSTLDSPCVPNANYFLGEQTSVSITLPNNAEIGQTIVVSWYNGNQGANVTIEGDVLEFDYSPQSNSRSEINALWDGVHWSVLGYEQKVDVDE